VGKNLKQYLEQSGYFVRALGLRDETKIPDDLPDTVIHLAGKAHDLKKSSNPEAYYAVNTELTKKVFDAFMLSDAKVFIMLSSVKVVGDSFDGVLTEDTIPNPQTDYGKSKLLAEQYILNFKMPEEKRVYVLRPCMIHGPGNKGNLNLLYKIASFGLPYPLAAYKNKRSFLTVSNLCFIIKELLQKKDIPSGIYNVADDMPLSTNRVIEIMCEELSKKAKLLCINKGVIKFIAKVGDFLPVVLNSERLNKLTEDYVVSNRKITIALNKSLPLDSETGLRGTIQSFIHGS